MPNSVDNPDKKLLIIKKENVIEHNDTYFTHAYAKLYESKEKGETQTLYYESRAGKIEYTFIKREIPFMVNSKQYYDITTAYGYGGPYIEDCTDLKTLISEFKTLFSNYCKKNNIISEFIRFHLFENQDVQMHFDGVISMVGHHIARDLKQPLTENFHKSIGTSVRKASRKGVTVSFDTEGEVLEDFLDIYHKTMNRNAADHFYYFEDDFFRNLHKNLAGKFVYINAKLGDKTIASFLTIVGKDYSYGFLGGSLEEYHSYNVATFLEYHLIEWLKNKGVAYYILGGGYKGDDGLYKFKKKFDLRGDYPFYIGKKIHDEKIYQKIVDLRELEGDFDSESNFFPLYRV